MQVHNQLSTFLSIIDDQPVPIFEFLLLCYFCSCQEQLTQNCLMSVFCVFDHVKSIFLLWNDQNMNRGLWADVSEGEDVVVFVDNIGGDFLSDYFVENSFVAHCMKDILLL